MMVSKEYQIEDFRNGNQRAFTWFVDQVLPAAVDFTDRLIKDPEAAKDLVSEAMAKLWQKRSAFESFANAKSFLFVSLRNASYNYLNSLQIRSMRRSVEVPEDILHPDGDLMARMIQSELIQLISEEVDRLPLRQAMVFRMSVLEGMNTEEICRALNLTAPAVHKAKSQSISAIRSVFKGKTMDLYLIVLLLTTPHFLDN